MSEKKILSLENCLLLILHFVCTGILVDSCAHYFTCFTDFCLLNKKHLKNVGPIRHNEPPHAHSADVASGTVTCRLCIDVHDNDDNDNT